MTVNRELPFTSLQSIILTTGPFVFFWTYLKGYVEKKGSLPWAETLLDAHNFILSTVSLILAAFILDIGHDVLVTRTGYVVDPYILGYFYHLLKLYEYLDVILAVLAGKTRITKYTAFSHLAMPYWSYYRIIDRPNDATDWRLHVIADCSVRFLSRAIPWLIEDVKVEEALLGMCEEFRWYADLIITGFWAFFTFQGQRENEQAIKIFGAPYELEQTARLISGAIVLYAGHTRRQEEKQAKNPIKKAESSQTSTSTTSATSTSRSDTTTSARTTRRR